VSGLEWNVRASSARNPAVVEKVAAVFESYWSGGDFVPYDPEEFAALTQAEAAGPGDPAPRRGRQPARAGTAISIGASTSNTTITSPACASSNASRTARSVAATIVSLPRCDEARYLREPAGRESLLVRDV
jgi:hypothetical protein